MNALARLALVVALLLLAGGTVVAPHVDPPGKPHYHVDHVPAALRLAILAKFGHLFQTDKPAFLSEAVAVTMASTLSLALLALPFPRPWRPGRLGVSRPPVALVHPQHRLAPAHAPPRALSFPS